MNPHYNQNYTREEIDAVLAKIQSCVEKDKYTVSLNENRKENIDFSLTQMAKKKPLMFIPNSM